MSTNETGEYAPKNVTNFSEGMWQSYYASAPKTSFNFEEGEYTIPYVYLDFNPEDPVTGVQFKYIQNFKLTFADFIYCGDGIVDPVLQAQKLIIYGNFPNPLKNETTIQIELYKVKEVNLTVLSITGQQLLVKDYGKLNQGKHDLNLQINNLSPGIYFYTIIAGHERITRKNGY